MAVAFASGVNDGLNFGSAAHLDSLGAGDMTVTMWLYRTADGTGSGVPTVLSKGLATSGWFIRCGRAGGSPALAFDFFTFHATTNRQRQSAANAVANNSWYFLAITSAAGVTGTDVHMYLAQPGAVPAELSYNFTQNGVGAYTETTTTNLLIGGANTTTNHWVGRMADVRLYSSILTAGKIQHTMLGMPIAEQPILWAPLLGYPSNEPDWSGRGGSAVQNATAVAGPPTRAPFAGMNFGGLPMGVAASSAAHLRGGTIMHGTIIRGGLTA